MPQMMPLNWLPLLFLFTLIFYIFNNVNYYNFFYASKTSLVLKMKISSNWKW
uniref:ATP synthase complex subunit 8 n=1 Tax=Longitarsus ibericus TaxID=1383033 RepID=A0A1P8NN13_9CUCU|nr:ATP synthase F0 subunit 8 [Longitarsus ibericus]